MSASSLTVAELKKKLTAAGLDASGLKAELVERWNAHEKKRKTTDDSDEEDTKKPAKKGKKEEPEKKTEGRPKRAAAKKSYKDAAESEEDEDEEEEVKGKKKAPAKRGDAKAKDKGDEKPKKTGKTAAKGKKQAEKEEEEEEEKNDKKGARVVTKKNEKKGDKKDEKEEQKDDKEVKKDEDEEEEEEKDTKKGKGKEKVKEKEDTKKATDEANKGDTADSDWKWKDTLMYWESPDIVHSDKLACFDYDGCLAKTSLHQKGPNAWSVLFTQTPAKLKELHGKGYKLVIMTNQADIGRSAKPESRAKAIAEKVGRLTGFVKEMGLPFQILVATAWDKKTPGDEFRKPATGFWKFATENNGGVKVDKSKSFFVGDAAGRKKDHSDTDKAFAAAAGLTFFTEDVFFKDGAKYD